MLIIPLNLDSALLLLHNSKLAYCASLSFQLIIFDRWDAKIVLFLDETSHHRWSFCQYAEVTD